MITTIICKAEPLLKPEKVKSRAIIIESKVPQYLDPPEWEKFCDGQAHKINSALAESLPQGIYDRLGIMFMQSKVSLYQGKTGT